uniref:Uncharacterized protein n=1 Tax=Attheya septentrionalis TaxID=420275 RepID=A0A7S2UJV6_9STRA|mmetsp:Transcript_25571/g.46312  ORF Transcript_25571/g.46312 Transcript_25571/m.46312 type:complete len:178 (+) Transcript_25571:87-620(+)
MYEMGHHMMINNLTELQEGAPSYCGKSQRDVPPSKFKASEPMLVPYSNSRKYQLSSSMSLGASSVDGMENMYDLITWQMYFRIMSARKQASLARVLAGEAEQTTPERVFSHVDVNEPQDQATSPIAFQAIPSKSRNINNHRHAQYTHVPPPLVSDTTSEEDLFGDSYHEGEVFTLDI